MSSRIRVMRDSVTADYIPISGTEIAAGYSTGKYANASALAARFPHIQRVLIDVNGSDWAASVRDWETGDKSRSLQDWVGQHNAHHADKSAVVYCNRSTIPEVRSLTGPYILGTDYHLWVATLDGTVYGPSSLPGVAACQYLGSPPLHFYDQSYVWETPGVPWTGWNPNVKPVNPVVHGPVRANVTWQGTYGKVTRTGIIPWDAWHQITWLT